MIVKQMLGVHWVLNKDGGAYYNDSEGNDWYEFRNKLANDLPIIAVNAESREVKMFHVGDPSYFGLLNEELDIYQVAYFPVKDAHDFMKRQFTFSKDGKITETTVAPVARTKEDIMADLIKLQEELKNM